MKIGKLFENLNFFSFTGVKRRGVVVGHEDESKREVIGRRGIPGDDRIRQ